MHHSEHTSEGRSTPALRRATRRPVRRSTHKHYAEVQCGSTMRSYNAELQNNRRTEHLVIYGLQDTKLDGTHTDNAEQGTELRHQARWHTRRLLSYKTSGWWEHTRMARGYKTSGWTEHTNHSAEL